MPGHVARLCTALLGLLLLLVATAAPATSGGPTYRYGAVFTRGIIYGPGNQPIYVEYDDNGAQGSEIGEAVGNLANAQVMATEQYRAYQAQLLQLRSQYPDLELAYREADYSGSGYTDPNFYVSGSYTTLDGDPIGKRELAPATVAVALMPPNQRYSSDPEQLILLELPIDPNKQPQPGSRSLLLAKTGAILWDSLLNIGYKTGYGANAEGLETGGDFHDTQKYYGPIAGVTVENTLGHATTTETGRYGLEYPLPPCPGFYYQMDLDLFAELYYKRFNPRGEAAPFPYYLKRDNHNTCNGLGELSLGNSMVAQMTQLAMQAITSSSTTSEIYERNFIVDLMVLAGQARMQEKVTVSAATRYDGTRAALERVAQAQYDFDGDAQPDKALLGRLITVTDPNTQEESQQFEELTADQSPELQGVWLSSRHDLDTLDIGATLPDLTRLADWSADFTDRGLLSQITLADLRNTDLYVLRESDGTLVTERHGLKDSAFTDIFLGVSSESGTFHYTIDIVGALEGIMNDFGYTSGGQYQQWQLSGQMNPKFYQRRADHLRPGELVRIVAINRATGYMGSITTPMQAAGTSGSTGEISFPIDDIVLGPPNLKIWAERTNKIEQGLTKGTQKEQAIGNEGAGLADDTLITVYTEWLDADGRPLPEALADHGYTGRLAKVIAPNLLGAVAGNTESGNKLSQFAIKPGRQTQVIRLPETVLGEQHLYVQVSGEPISQKPDFSTSELVENATLQYRPDHYVPFKTPVYDEDSSLLQQQAYREAKAAFEAGDITTEPKKPEPFYQWAYRPEFQFSVYDLAMEEIRRTDADGTAQDILNVQYPSLDFSDLQLELFYALNDPDYAPLTPYSYEGDRELIFSLGGQEVTASLIDGHVIFDNLAYLENLGGEDYLTIRLYSNNDTANVLWEFAFKLVDIDVDSDNNNGFGQPELNLAEDEVEDQPNNPDTPGKILSVNNEDLDKDGIPDFADMDYSSANTNNFAQVVISLPKSVTDLSNTWLRFYYLGSDPTAVQTATDSDPDGVQFTVYSPAPGMVRIWRKPANKPRNPLVDYITPSTADVQNNIPAQTIGFTEDIRQVTLFIEGVKASETWGDTSIRFEVETL
jgi:hypothetical protein